MTFEELDIKDLDEVIKIENEVRTTNTKAYNLYKKLGFIETRTRKDYYGEGQDCLDMVKGLLGLNEEDFSD